MSNARQFSLCQKELFNVLASLMPICTKRTTLDLTASILFHVRHKELILKGTDLEISLQASCFIEYNSSPEGFDFLVSGKRIHDIVKELEGTISFTLETGVLVLASSGVTVRLNVSSSEHFPAFPERIENLMSIDSDKLCELLKSTLFVIPQTHATIALTGLLWEVGPTGFILTATDGHCLAQAKTDSVTLLDKQSWIVPRRALSELIKLIELMDEKTVLIGMCGKHLALSGERFNFFTRLLAGNFPSYESVLHYDSFVPACLDRGHLTKTLRRATTLLSGNFIATQFSLGENALEVTMYNKEVGGLKEELAIESYAGSPLRIHFYAPYMLHGLHIFQECALKVFFKSAMDPIIFSATKPSGAQLTYLVMPVCQTGGMSVPAVPPSSAAVSGVPV